MMYRSRLGNDLSDITLEYVSSIKDDSEIALFDILGSQAHVLMLQENKIISKIDAKKIPENPVFAEIRKRFKIAQKKFASSQKLSVFA